MLKLVLSNSADTEIMLPSNNYFISRVSPISVGAREVSGKKKLQIINFSLIENITNSILSKFPLQRDWILLHYSFSAPWFTLSFICAHLFIFPSAYPFDLFVISSTHLSIHQLYRPNNSLVLCEFAFVCVCLSVRYMSSVQYSHNIMNHYLMF